MKKKVILSNPPLIELVIGIQFNKAIINNDLIIKIYNSLLSKEFPKVEEKPSIPASIEEYNKPTITKILNGFYSRKLFISNDNNKLIQIQPDKILFNWRKISSGDLYPRFQNVYKEFTDFLKKLEKIIEYKDYINQYEITYIDHFQLDLFDICSFNISKLFNIFFLNENEEISNIGIKYSIPQNSINGNLNISIQSAIRNIDNKKIIVLENTCRGFNKNTNMDNWFNDSHDILYNHFFNLLKENTKIILRIKNE